MTALTDRFDRTVTFRKPDGTPLASLNSLHGVIAAAVAVLVAPRLTAVSAIGALIAGMSITIDAPAGSEPEA